MKCDESTGYPKDLHRLEEEAGELEAARIRLAAGRDDLTKGVKND